MAFSGPNVIARHKRVCVNVCILYYLKLHDVRHDKKKVRKCPQLLRLLAQWVIEDGKADASSICCGASARSRNRKKYMYVYT